MSLKAKVKESEGEDMREAIQDKVCRRCISHMCAAKDYVCGDPDCTGLNAAPYRSTSNKPDGATSGVLQIQRRL